MSLSVLSVASEAFPLIKTGGLADVAGALPAALAPHDVAVTTLLPAYPAVKARLGAAKAAHRWKGLLGEDVRLLKGKVDGLDLLLVDAPALFDRPGGPYADAQGRDWSDNWLRFALLGRVAAELGLGRVKSQRFDLVHAHDWQAALAPAYIRYAPEATKSKTILTIHNIAFQGQFGPEVFASLELPPAAWAVDGIEYYGDVGLLKAGLTSADAITTVSPTYAREIMRPEFGMGLEGIIAHRRAETHGILNGIDRAIWNPAHDAHLAATYTASKLSARKANKRAVEASFGLKRGDGPLFIVISRLSWQKGIDSLIGAVDALVGLGGRLAVLGAGDAALEGAFRAAAARHPGLVSIKTGYDEPLSHLMQGGGDAILIPSRFEPCGLTQLYGLAYGCVPVVARTGGLADTIIDANAAACAAGVATGLMGDGATPEALIEVIARAVQFYADKPVWRSLQRAGMKADFSWRASGRLYAELYARLLKA